jgi:RNA polymerase sigma-70 factor (ECF subfamily)
MTVVDAEVHSGVPFSRDAAARAIRAERRSMGPVRDQGDDETLLTRIARSDRQAFQAVYDRYSGPVYSLALSMLRDPPVAQEITQDVFLAIWRGAGAFDLGRGTARSWILSLAHHKSVDAVRRWRRAVTAPLSEGIRDDADVVEEAMRRVDSAGVHDALRALSADQREAIVLAYYGGYTQREIADRQRAPLGTVKTRIRDGLLRLREMLGKGVREETVR